MLEPTLGQRAHSQLALSGTRWTTAMAAPPRGPDPYVWAHRFPPSFKEVQTSPGSHLLPRRTSCALKSLLESGGIKIDQQIQMHSSSHTTSNGTLGLEIADYAHKQTYLKRALLVNRRLSLKPGHGLPANGWPQPALASLGITFCQAGPGAWGLPTCSSQLQAFTPHFSKALGPWRGKEQPCL